MSLLHDPQFAIHRLRTLYLQNSDDGVAERVISLNPAALNTLAYKQAGWTNAQTRRCYSPPIPAFGDIPFNNTRPTFRNSLDDSDLVLAAPAGRDTRPGSRRLKRSETGTSTQNEGSEFSDDDDYMDEEIALPQSMIAFPKRPLRMASNTNTSTPSQGTPIADDDLKTPKVLVTGPSRPNSASRVPKADMGESTAPAVTDTFKDQARKLDPVQSMVATQMNTSPAMSLANEATLNVEPFEESDASVTSSEYAGTIGSDTGFQAMFTTPTAYHKPLPKPRPISTIQPSSALTALFKANEAADHNPLAHYAVFSGKGDLNPLRLKIYRPSGAQPTVPWEVLIRSTANVAETIGYALYRYQEDALMPELAPEEFDANRWTLRIVEEDGEPDEDFPALDRKKIISEFRFDEFALVEATEAQALVNEATTPNPNKQFTAKPAVTTDGPLTSGTPPTQAAVNVSSPNTTPRKSANSKPLPAEPRNLKIRIHPHTEGAPVSTVSVMPETSISEVLGQICRRKNLDRIKYCLRIPGTSTLVSNDKTVESLNRRLELELIKRKLIDPTYVPGAPLTANNLRQDMLMPGYGAANAVITNASYQKYIVWRRQPMSFMGRHERVLAIDGDYIHIMPSEQKTLFESPKTSSIHIGAIITCKQSRKVPANFKFVVLKARETKRYDFEAINPKEAAEIVSKVRTLMNSLKG
ncbi:SIN1-domain-containing protein [Saitoella complicata NRRL Y-17804]|uniref:SIN1-domain-containing protein n=1 Tax=Saitoella complicata (strain BCRC 22490 / CBS 7301 / JCM 7358 / NBRC 10748 / NRRL Y-17804) TaxID=698492 RepID=UPI00086828F4|nr:SIN1-domain-containing protein [Saitoella complicata NRRL Y-17804]ODQ53639.1 SIN1-domain-containing protein [Saitoella complicata NRRL Y-17804]